MVKFLMPIIFGTPASLSKSKYFLVETDKVKLPTEIKKDDGNGTYRNRQTKGMINKEVSTILKSTYIKCVYLILFS